jgi:type I restriction enzyme S subunit
MPAVSEVTASIERPEIRTYAEVKKGFTYFGNEDVLFAKITPCMENGKSAIATKLYNGVGFGSTEFHVIRANKKLLLPKFLHYFIRQQSFRNMAKSRMRGAVGQQRVPKDFLDDVKLPLPPLSEQRRIVEILDQADALPKKRAEADAKAARILPALFYKMFGDPATNPKGWNIKPLSDFEAQVRYGLGQPPKTSTTGVALIRATNISRGTISPRNMIYVDPQDVPPGRNAFLKKDEVLVVRSGAYTGDIAQVTKEWEGCVAGYDLVITPGSYLTGEFVEAYLLMPFIQKGYFYNLKARAGQPHLNAAQVSATPLLDVPRDLQIQFSKAVQTMRKLRKQWEAINENLEKTFAILLHRAFTGELTSKWREAYMKKLLAEMEAQAKVLNMRGEP